MSVINVQTKTVNVLPNMSCDTDGLEKYKKN